MFPIFPSQGAETGLSIFIASIISKVSPSFTSCPNGNILKIMVELGQEVKEGDTLLIMEAMKMESPVSAPCDGKIGNIAVSAGATVQTGELLLTIE